MATKKVAITLEEKTVGEVDSLVARRSFPSRSRVIQEAVAEKLAKMNRSRLAEQCALLDRDEEQSMAEEFSDGELELWLQC